MPIVRGIIATIVGVIGLVAGMPDGRAQGAPPRRIAAVIISGNADDRSGLDSALRAFLDSNGRESLPTDRVVKELSADRDDVDPFDDVLMWQYRMKLGVDELIVAHVDESSSPPELLVQIVRADGTWRRERDLGEREGVVDGVVAMLRDGYADIDQNTPPTVFPGATAGASRKLMRPRGGQLDYASVLQVGAEVIYFSSDVFAVYSRYEGMLDRPVVFDVELALVKTETGTGVYLGAGTGVRIPVAGFLVVPTIGAFAASGSRDLLIKLSVEVRRAINDGVAFGVTGGLVSDLTAVYGDFEAVAHIRAGLSFRIGN